MAGDAVFSRAEALKIHVDGGWMIGQPPPLQ
jgi:hypothetical protein